MPSPHQRSASLAQNVLEAPLIRSENAMNSSVNLTRRNDISDASQRHRYILYWSRYGRLQEEGYARTEGIKGTGRKVISGDIWSQGVC